MSLTRSARPPGITAILLLVGLFTMQSGLAQEDESSWSVWIGAYFPDVDTTISFRSETLGVGGSLIDFEDDLGLKDRNTLPIAGLKWRINKRHSLDLLYFQLARSGSQALNATLSFPCDIIDPANCMPGVPNAPNTCGDTLCILDTTINVNSKFDVGIVRLGYAYTFYNRENTQWAVSGGIHADRMTVKMADSGNILGGTVVDEQVVPLPSIGLEFRHRFRPKWSVMATAEWFGIEISEIKGSLVSASALLEYAAWDQVSLALAWNHFELDVEAGDTDFKGIFEWRYTGPVFALKYDF